MNAWTCGSVAVVVALVACDTGGGSNGDTDVTTVVEVDLGSNLGPQRATAWTATLTNSTDAPTEWSLIAGEPDAFYTFKADSTGIWTKRSPSTAIPLWTTSIDLLSDGSGTPSSGFFPAREGGGLVQISQQIAGFQAARSFVAVAPDGAQRWRYILDASTLTGRPLGVSLANGNAAVFYETFVPDGGLALPERMIAVLGPTGTPTRKVTVPRIHLPEADHPGTNNGPHSPGTGVFDASVGRALDDGGMVVAGYYVFNRLIECGSQEDPKDPVTNACGNGSIVGMFARFDDRGDLVWAKRVGDPYTTGDTYLSSLEILSDGTFATTGYRYAAPTNTPSASITQAIAVRFTATGDIRWSHAIPFGPAPGSSGSMKLDGIAPQTGGAFEAILGMQDKPYRLLRFEADGSVSRVQLLEPLGTPGTNNAPAGVSHQGGELAYSYSTRPDGPFLISKLAPAP